MLPSTATRQKLVACLASPRSIDLRRSMSTFVSKHNKIGVDEVRTFLNNVPGMEQRETDGHFVVKDCAVMPEGFCLKVMVAVRLRLQ